MARIWKALQRLNGGATAEDTVCVPPGARLRFRDMGLGLVTPLAPGSCAWLHMGQHCTQRARRSPIRCTSSAGLPQREQCAITGRKRTHRLAVSLGSDSLPSDTGGLVITGFVAARRIPAVTRGGPDRFSGFLLLPPPICRNIAI